MMIYGFTLNGSHCSVFGVVMISKTLPVLPVSNDSYLEIPNRDGAYLSPGRLADGTITIECGLSTNSVAELVAVKRQISAWIYSKERAPLVFDDETDKTYMAKYDTAIGLNKLRTPGWGTFTLVFRCQPFAEGLQKQQTIGFGLPIFSRSGIATRQDLSQVASGVVRYEQGYFHNLLTDNQASIETDTTGMTPFGSATLSRDTSTFYKGSASLKVVTPGLTSYEGVGINNVKLKPSTQYTASAYIKGNAGGEQLQVVFNWYDANSVLISQSTATNPTLTTSYARYTHTATSPANAAYCTFKVAGNGTVAITFWVDCIQVEEGSVAKDWILPSVGKAYFGEEYTDNKAVYSDPSSAAQSNTATNVTYATAIFFNLVNAVVFGDNTLQRAVYQLATLAINTVYTISCYVKMDDGTAPVVGINTTSGDFGLVVNQILVTTNIIVEPIGGGIYRVSGQYTTPGTITSNSAGVIKYTTSTAKTFKVGGFQIESKKHTTSYMPTSGTIATRSNDQLEIEPVPLINPNEGSICGRFWMGDGDDSHYSPIFSSYDTPTAKTLLSIHRYTTPGQYVTGPYSFFVTQPNIAAYSTSPNYLQLRTWMDFTFTWSVKNKRQRLYLNGVLGKEVIVDIPIPLGDRAFIGSYMGGGTNINGCIDDFFISRRELTSTEVLAFHNATKQYQVDADTTYSLAFDGTLTPSTPVNTVINTGTATGLPIITATFSVSGATDYKVTHLETGKSVRVINNFNANDVLVIDHSKMYVTINGSTAMPKLDLSSEFFELNKGTNTLTISMATGGSAYTQISYKERWL